MLARNCCTPVDYWLSMTLAELQVWIDANNGLFDKDNANNKPIKEAAWQAVKNTKCYSSWMQSSAAAIQPHFPKQMSGPSELQKEIRSLQSVQADISAYTKQQAAVEKTQAKLDNLNKQYQLLQQEIKETSGPTTSLERESAKLEAAHW